MTVIADQQVTIPFADPECTDSARTGGKGSNLGRLTAAGLAVPPGFVIPTDTWLAPPRIAT
jgi:phosphoenolpyruvate synthase/pyruvate phosphate dikinase